PSNLFLSGGSAGGTLSSIAALTPGDPRYQPGFEDADTSVTAVASLYGWYDGYYEMGGPRSEMGVLGHTPKGRPAVLHRARDRGHPGPRRDRPSIRRPPARRLAQPDRVRRTPTRPTQLRFVPLLPVLGGR